MIGNLLAKVQARLAELEAKGSRVSAPDAVPVTVYLGCLFSLIAAVRVHGAARMRFLKLVGAPVAQAGEAEAHVQAPPVGLLASALFFLAELVSAHALFIPASKGKTAPVVKFVHGVQTGWATCVDRLRPPRGGPKRKASQSVTGQMVSLATCVSQEMFSTEEQMITAHGLVVLCFLGALVALLGHRAATVGNSPKTWRMIALGAIIVACVAFITFHTDLLGKVWRKVMAAKLVTPLQTLFRTAAVIVAEGPGDKEDHGTPVLWSVFQLAALVTFLIQGLTNKAFIREAASLQHAGLSMDTLVKLLPNSIILSHLLPCFSATLWLAFQHLQTRPLWLMLASLVAVLASPNSLAIASTLLGAELGQTGDTVLVGFRHCAAIVYCIIAATALIAGGGLNLFCVFALLQVLLRIHGIEAFFPAESVSASM